MLKKPTPRPTVRRRPARLDSRFGHCRLVKMPSLRYARLYVSARAYAVERHRAAGGIRAVTRSAQYAAATPPVRLTVPAPAAPAAAPVRPRRKAARGLLVLVVLAVLSLTAALYVSNHPELIKLASTQVGFVMEAYDASATDAHLYEITARTPESITELQVDVLQEAHALEITAKAAPAEGCSVESLLCEITDSSGSTVFSQTGEGAQCSWAVPGMTGKYDIRVTARATDDSLKTVKYTAYVVGDDNESTLVWPVEPQYQILAHDRYQVNNGVEGRSGFTHNNGRRRMKHYVYGTARSHYGLDITAVPGTEVVAAAAGTVVGVFYDSDSIGSTGYGKYLIVHHDEQISGEDYYTLYAHLSKIEVSKGIHLAQGELIAYSGSTGGSRIPHLHFEIRLGDSSRESTIDPLDALPSRTFSNLSSTLDPTLGFAQSSCALYEAMLYGEWDYPIYALTKQRVTHDSVTIPANTQVEVYRRSGTEVICIYEGAYVTCQSSQLLYTYDLPADSVQE